MTVEVPTRDDIGRAAEAIAPHVRHTPVIELDGEPLGLDITLIVKLEYLQVSGSFKGRGAAHFLATQPIGAEGVVAASGGNHGAAVAWAARRFGHAAHIFVPSTATPAKVERLRDLGADIHLVGETYDDALEASITYLADHEATRVEAFDHPVIMAGAGTCARELDLDSGRDGGRGLDAVLLACGGGGLSGGAAAWFGKGGTRVVACETEGTASYAKAREAGELVDIAVSGLAADSLGAKRLGALPWKALRAADAASAVVTDSDLIAAQRLIWDWLRVVVEPGAAAPVAALSSGAWRPTPGARVGLVLCGANVASPLAIPAAVA